MAVTVLERVRGRSFEGREAARVTLRDTVEILETRRRRRVLAG